MAEKKTAVVYNLHKNELVSNSPYSLEGTDVTLDIPPQRNVPWKMEIMLVDSEGDITERTVRYIRGASSIFLDEQVKAGIPINRKPTRDELLDLTFINGVNETIRPNLIRFLNILPLNEKASFEKDDKKFSVQRKSNQRLIYTVIDRAAIKKSNRDQADLILDAYTILKRLEYSQMQDAIRLRGVSWAADEDDSLLFLKDVIDTHKDGAEFMVNFGNKIGIETIANAMVSVVEKNDKKPKELPKIDTVRIIVQKLIDAKELSLESIPNHVALNNADGKPKVLCKLEDGGDLTSKTERFIDFLLESPENLAILKTRVAQIEKK